ncbi:hypothetical protein Dimus_008733, partial [Dionaea muscipula]
KKIHEAKARQPILEIEPLQVIQQIWLLQAVVADEEKVEEVLVFDSSDESENDVVKEGEEALEPPVSQSGDIPCSDQTPNLVEVETEEVEARAIRKQEIICRGKP